MTGFVRDLAEIVGDAHVLTDSDATLGFRTDWTGRWVGDADAVVRPRTTEEVSRVVAACAAAGAQICVQGGNTGLVGGSVPPARPTNRDGLGDGGAAPTILVSLARMTGIEDVDQVGRCIGVQAGVNVAAIDAHAGRAGLMFGVDLASRESATAGGVVATNAGGIRMVRHGDTRAQILGIEAVLADGRILRRWSPLVKDNVGYDLPGLLAGSEGTLAVITGVLFRLVVPPGATAVAFAGVRDLETALDLIDGAARRGLTVEAAEIMTGSGIALVHGHGVRRPLETDAPFHLLLEVSGTPDIQNAAVGLLADVSARTGERAGGLVDAVVEPGPARALWSVREAHTETIARSSVTPVVKLDVSVPIRELPATFAELEALPSSVAHACRPILFGHVGDGNIHVNLLDVPVADADALTARVFAIVGEHGGSISAEHGIGRAKSGWTHLGRSDTDLEMMRAIKATFDPGGILNPGVIFG